MTRLTLYGIYQYDKTLFDGVELPPGIDKNLLISDIISTCGDLYTYYQVPPILKINITSWFKRRYHDFGKMYDALRAEYVPLENYNRTETRTQSDSMSGTDRQTNSATSNTATQSTNSNTNSATDANTGTDSTDSTDSGNSTSEQSVSAYNAETYSNRERTQETKSNSNNSTVTYNTTLTHNSTDSGTNSSNTDNTASGTLTTDYGKRNDTREEVNVHGNIGVTTNQQMISAEIDMREKYDLYRIITQEFEREFLIQIY